MNNDILPPSLRPSAPNPTPPIPDASPTPLASPQDKSARERLAATLLVLAVGAYFSYGLLFAIWLFGGAGSISSILYVAIPLCCMGVALWLSAKKHHTKYEYLYIAGLLLCMLLWPRIFTEILSLPGSLEQRAEARDVTITHLSDDLLISGKGNPTGIRITFDVTTAKDKTLPESVFDHAYMVRANAVTPDEKRLAKSGIYEYELGNYNQSTIQTIIPEPAQGTTLKAGITYHFSVGLRPSWLYDPGACYADTREEDRIAAYSPAPFRLRVALFSKEVEAVSTHTYTVKDFYTSAAKEGVKSCIARDRAEWTEMGLDSTEYKNDYFSTKHPWSATPWQHPGPNNTKDVKFFASIPQQKDGNNTELALRISYGPKVTEAVHDVTLEQATTLGGLPATLYAYTGSDGQKKMLVRLNQPYRDQEFNFVLEKMEYLPEFTSILARLQFGNSAQNTEQFLLSPTNTPVTITGKVIGNTKFRPQNRDNRAYFITVLTTQGALAHIAYYDPAARCENRNQLSTGQQVRVGQTITATGLFAYPETISLCEDPSYTIK